MRVTGYYPVDEQLESAMAAIREGLSGLRAQNLPFDLGKLEVLTHTVDEEDWAESWKKDFTPIRLGRHMVVKPSWCEYEAQAGDHIIELDPGMAFGTGTHETTGMCVRLVEEHVRPGQKVIDLGTGTGILAIAAAHMGARDVLAIDLDAVAVRVAKENVENNGFAEIIRVQQGDLLDHVDEARGRGRRQHHRRRHHRPLRPGQAPHTARRPLHLLRHRPRKEGRSHCRAGSGGL